MSRSLSCCHRLRSSRGGVTLVELLVVLLVLSGMAMIVGLTWRAGLGDNRDNDPNRRATAVLSARTRALKTGKIVTQAIPIEGEVVIITALPDGRVVGADRLGFDPLSGRHEKQPAPDVDPHFRSFYAVDRANISANTTHAPDEL